MIAVGDLAREAAPAVLLLVDLADEGPGVGRAGDDPDLWRAAEILELLHRHLASGWFGVQGQIVRHFRVRLAASWAQPAPVPAFFAADLYSDRSPAAGRTSAYRRGR